MLIAKSIGWIVAVGIVAFLVTGAGHGIFTPLLSFPAAVILIPLTAYKLHRGRPFEGFGVVLLVANIAILLALANEIFDTEHGARLREYHSGFLWASVLAWLTVWLAWQVPLFIKVFRLFKS